MTMVAAPHVLTILLVGCPWFTTSPELGLLGGLQAELGLPGGILPRILHFDAES